MEINGFPTSFFPPLTSLRTQANEAESAAAAARLSVSNDPPQNKADILLQSFFFVSRETPRVELNGPAAALRIVDSIDFLTRRSQTAKLPLIANLGRTSRFADLQLNSIKGIQQSLRNLSETVRNLRAAGSLNPLAARSSQASLVEASAGGNSPVSTFPVVPTQAALNAVLASNAQSSPLGPIGKSGSFIINGFQVDVISTDSLVDIKNKINLGEDRNNNGRLDRQEDINGNGSADILQATATEFGAGQFVIEDRNGSGTLDPSEDRNNNNRLDGGSAGIGVVATVEGNRLVLTGQTGAAGGIDLQDPNGLLLNLGFFELNSKGRPIPREIQFNTKEPPVNLNVSSQGATLTLDGTPLTSDTNVFKGAVKDVTLTVKQASKKTARIEIFIDAANVMNQIQPLFDQFNQSIRLLNDTLAFSREFQSDADIQRLRNNLKKASQDAIPEITRRNALIDEVRTTRENQQKVGVFIENTGKKTLREVSVTRIVQGIKDGLAFPFKKTGNDLLRRLSSIGIQTREDDTFRVNEAEFKRALTVNTEEVLNIFTNADSGILPRLENQLNRILDQNLGDLALKQVRVEKRSAVPSQLAEKFKKFVENQTIQQQFQNLIAVA